MTRKKTTLIMTFSWTQHRVIRRYFLTLLSTYKLLKCGSPPYFKYFKEINYGKDSDATLKQIQ